MTDYRAYIFHVNREDLLQKAVASARDLWKELTVVDNSTNGLEVPIPYVHVLRPTVPLTAIQSINFAMMNTRTQGAKIAIWMHSDAEAHPGSCLALVEYARRMNVEGRKWGTLFTNYDALAALNTELIDTVGLWDTTFHSYFGDNDYYRRIRLAGYECIDTGIPVYHTASQTINSDPELRFRNSITFPLYQAYYVAKYGGSPGNETYSTPFNRQGSTNLK
jgi:hypothetical protein